MHVQRAESKTQHKRIGRPLEVHISLTNAKIKEQQAIECYDLFVWLQSEIRQSLQPYDSEYNLTSVRQTKETLDTAISLLSELGDNRVKDYAQCLKKHRDELIAPLEWLEQRLSSYRQEWRWSQ